MSRFDARGFAVRWVFGHAPWPVEVPGIVESRIVKWANGRGLTVYDQSLTSALEQVEEMRRLRTYVENEEG